MYTFFIVHFPALVCKMLWAYVKNMVWGILGGGDGWSRGIRISGYRGGGMAGIGAESVRRSFATSIATRAARSSRSTMRKNRSLAACVDLSITP